METLEAILKRETNSLREQYIEKTIEWAKKHFDIIIERVSWKEEQWAKFLGIEPVIRNPGLPGQYIGFPRGFYGTKNARILDRLQNEARKLVRLGLDGYLKSEEQAAEAHYESSIKKLAYRINQKGLDISKLRVKTSHIGVNIDTILTDGDQTVRAFTILAHGDVNRPHYRYLVK